MTKHNLPIKIGEHKSDAKSRKPISKHLRSERHKMEAAFILYKAKSYIDFFVKEACHCITI